MAAKARKWLKNIVQTALLVFLVSLVADWWRKPVQPLESAGEPLYLLDGSRVSLNSFSDGRTAVVYFWGSWCDICRHTSPVIKRLQQAGIPVLSIALQSGSDEEVRAYMDKQGLDFDTANDADGALSSRWKIAATPTVVLVKNGKMIHSTTGLSSYWGLRGRLWLADRMY